MLVHAAQKVVLEGCRFIDCTLVLVSGADVELKDTEFTQGEQSTYSCSLVASGEGTVLSTLGGKITGGTIGVTVYGGATASLTDAAVEQISVSGLEARDARTSMKLNGCSLLNFATDCRTSTYPVHAHAGSSMHLDTVQIDGSIRSSAVPRSQEGAEETLQRASSKAARVVLRFHTAAPEI